MNIVYNQPIEINRTQYELVRGLTGIVATRTSGWWFWKKYYVKLWMMNYERVLRNYLEAGVKS